MKKILIPIDGSKRSLKSIELAKSLYAPEKVEIDLILVREDLYDIRSEAELEDAKQEALPILSREAQQLIGYTVKQHVLFGRAGDEILNFADENNVDIIFMTKSTRKGWSQIIGSVATHIVKYAKCIVVIVPEI